MSDFKDRLVDCNSLLNKIKLQVTGGKIYFRGVFPPKPNETQWARSRLASGCSANLSGLKLAFERAKLIDAQLVLNTFDWEPFLKGRLKKFSVNKSAGDWIEEFTENFWLRVEKSINKQSSFKTNYSVSFSKLKTDDPLNLQSIMAVIKTSPADSALRRRDVIALSKLARFAKLPQDDIKHISEFVGSYSSSKVELQILPSDEEIYKAWLSIKNPGWKWLYSLIAVYGVRPHETFYISEEKLNDSPPILIVLEGTKTGRREVYPCRAKEWIDFSPENVIYTGIAHRDSNRTLGSKVGCSFSKYKIPHSPYKLRHAYARRMFLRGFGSDFIAKSMGHSEEVHRRSYRSWWGQQPYDDMYKRVMDRWESEED